MCRQGGVVALFGQRGQTIGKMGLLIYRVEAVINIVSPEVQLMGSVGMKIKVGPYAQVIDAVSG